MRKISITPSRVHEKSRVFVKDLAKMRVAMEKEDRLWFKRTRLNPKLDNIN